MPHCILWGSFASRVRQALEAEHLKARLKAAEDALANEVAAKARSERQLQEQAEKQAPPMPDCSAFLGPEGHVL